MRLIKQIAGAFKRNRKRETLNYLQDMSDRQLLDCGFSPALVKQGIKAWPWREDGQLEELSQIERLITKEQQHIDELQRFSDAELADLGIYRGSIRDSIRHGRPGLDETTIRKAA